MPDEELERLKREFKELEPQEDATRARLLNEFETVVRIRLRGDAGRYVKQARNIEFSSINFFGRDDPAEDAKVFTRGRSEMVELIRSVQHNLDELERAKSVGTISDSQEPMDSATIERLAKIVCGGEGSPDPYYPVYRSSWYLTRFFKDAGLPQYVHDGTTRKTWVMTVLGELNRDELERVIKRLVLRKEYNTEQAWQKAVEVINEALLPEDLKVNGDPRTPILQFIGAAPMGRPSETTPHANNKRIFVVHGRTLYVRDAMFAFLRALGLEPIEWEHAVMSTGTASPYIGNVIEKAIREAAAVVVLLAPEDEARLLPEFHEAHDPDYETQLTPQARPNVLFEAGMAFGVLPERTFIVQLGRTRPLSDVTGRNTIRFSGDSTSRNSLASRLEGIGIPVDRRGQDWLRAGDFKPK